MSTESALRDLFSADRVTIGRDYVTIANPSSFTGLALIQACEHLGCQPGELFIRGEHLDGGCDTCDIGAEDRIILEIRRAR